LPVFFRQKRASIRGGKTFGFIKFRSMVRNGRPDEIQ
jgi:lipopolysaccharide/colanic/teichoic acid biosynthesis glycosyltransferase